MVSVGVPLALAGGALEARVYTSFNLQPVMTLPTHTSSLIYSLS